MAKLINGEYDPDVMRGMINENRRLLGMKPMPAAKETEMQGRARFEQWGVMHDMLKRYQMTWSDALGTYYNGYWQRAWESWQAGAREELLSAAKEAKQKADNLADERKLMEGHMWAQFAAWLERRAKQ